MVKHKEIFSFPIAFTVLFLDWLMEVFLEKFLSKTKKPKKNPWNPRSARISRYGFVGKYSKNEKYCALNILSRFGTNIWKERNAFWEKKSSKAVDHILFFPLNQPSLSEQCTITMASSAWRFWGRNKIRFTTVKKSSCFQNQLPSFEIFVPSSGNIC